MKTVCLTAACFLLVSISGLSAREIPRSAYIRFVPLSYPRLVQQTAASDSLHLYGDRSAPGYRDKSPVDGIDDRRHDVLLALAVRFAPNLVQNSTNCPVNFDTYIENSGRFSLHMDTWNVSAGEGALVHSDSVNLSRLENRACAEENGTTQPHDGETPAVIDDCKLLELLDDFAPWNPEKRGFDQPFVRQQPDMFTVLFLDFPGEGAGSWEDAYRKEYEKTPVNRRGGFPHAYVHPFVHEVSDDRGVHVGYDLVLQYWLFYPSNDGGNNHEGDWEHINVVVAPMSEVDRPLSARTLERILEGDLPATDTASDALVIRRVEYYFHHYVMTLDFTRPNVYQRREDWKAEVERMPIQRLRENDIWREIRHLAYVDNDETIVNTHPLGYIGADNKGFDQALSRPGGKNRNSHGTFPFPGRYHDIGPAGATEQVSAFVDPRRYRKRLDDGKVGAGPDFKRGSVIGLADPERLRIVPDWERVAGLARTNPRARRDWNWLLLPIRWGYPATESPLSGILPHTDTGNLAPVGPSFSTGWNVSGESPGFHTYEPHSLPSVFPLGLQDSFRNDFGFFNFTVPLLTTLPPLDFTSRFGTYPLKLLFGRRDPVYYPKERVPFRFFALSTGVSIQIVDSDFQALIFNPKQYGEFIASILFHLVVNGADSTTAVTSTPEHKGNSVQAFFQVPFYIGRHFTSENTVRNVRSKFENEIVFNNIPTYRYTAELNYWEYAGSLRYSMLTSWFQPFLKAGYGWSWYRWENVRANGVPFDHENSDWIKPRSLWPNVWHLALGIEYVPWKRVGTFPGGVEVALRAEYGRYFETLGLDFSSVPLKQLGLVFPTLGDVPANQRVTRDDFLFGLSVSF